MEEPVSPLERNDPETLDLVDPVAVSPKDEDFLTVTGVLGNCGLGRVEVKWSRLFEGEVKFGI